MELKQEIKEKRTTEVTSKVQLTQRERATAVHVWRPTANESKLIDPATDIGYDAFAYARWRYCLAWMLPVLKFVSAQNRRKIHKNPYVCV